MVAGTGGGAYQGESETWREVDPCRSRSPWPPSHARSDEERERGTTQMNGERMWEGVVLLFLLPFLL